MADTYTDEDARYDDEALNGPRCPRHGRGPCGCCIKCGSAEGKKHARGCDEEERVAYEGC